MPQLAFPTAMGAGAYSTGGRGGKIIHVTKLTDDGSEGTLRWAFTHSSNIDQKKTIVFDVSGVIQLNNDLIVADYSNFANGLTIAGQTAAGGGITITGGKIRMFGVDDIIVRYVKFRSTTNTNGCFASVDGNNVIFDHLSGSHVESNEVTFSVTSSSELTTDKTLQNILVSNSGLGFIIGDTTPPNDTHNEKVTLINNAFVNVGWRAPAKIGSAVIIDVINNTVHNWTSRLIRIDDWSYTMNHVGNYYTVGGRGTSQACAANSQNRGTGRIYEDDNYLDPAFTSRDYLWTQFEQPRTAPLPSSTFVNTPFTYNNVETLNIKASANLRTEVLPFIGAYKYINDNAQAVVERDVIDTSAIEQAVTNDKTQGSNEVSYTISLAEIPTQNNVRPVNFYVSNPHIPEVYLDSRAADLAAEGISKTDVDVHNYIMPSGYTLFEEYINIVDGNESITDIPVITLNGSNVINLTIGDNYTELGATATDNTDGDITNDIIIGGDTVDVNTLGTYVVTYNVQDSEGNNATQVNRTVNVTNGGIPTIKITNEVTIPNSTNIISWGNDFTQDYWEKNKVTVEPNTVIPSDSITDATKVTAMAETNYHNLKSTDNLNDSTISVFAKAGTINYLQFIDTSSSPFNVVNFNLSNGASNIFSGSKYSNPVMTDEGNGWYRCSVSISGSHNNTHLNITNGDNNGNVALTTSDYLYIRNIQQESGSLTDYIETNGEPETRIGASYNTVIQGQTYTDDGATATDPEDGDLTEDIVVTGTVDTSTTGIYFITYNVTDSDGNSAPEKTREVRVIASSSNIPVITRTDNNPTTYNVGDEFLGITGTWTDTEDGSGTASVNLGNLNMNTAGVYNVTLFHTDADGNTGSLIVPITVNSLTGNIEYDITGQELLKSLKTIIKWVKQNSI